MTRMTRRILWLASLVAVGSCASHSAPQSAPTTTAQPHENLNAVVWMQTALEYEATATQAYRLATLQLDAALKDSSWTAALEQTGDASKLPPAVVLDIDETVLDNSYFQARMVRDHAVYSTERWGQWVREARAPAIPGALEFTQYAAGKGVTVFYISNRMADLETPTRANLQALKFPVADKVDTVLSRGERPEWQVSAKGPRRAHVARDYRILLLIGDDLGDFVVNADGTSEERRARTAPNAEWWGRRWIMLPNPTYGSWERAVIGNASDRVAARHRALRFEPK
jgi:5'-nucleotidase (lipoprotein e(P4) family)